MQVMIMAAGLGSRLKDLTTATPKALIEVASRPLIDYALAFARAAGGERRIVVGGFCHADVAARVAAVAPGAVVVENREFRKGNLLSMLAGASALAPGGFLLMNTDHVYKPSIAKLVGEVCAAATEITAFCDFEGKGEVPYTKLDIEVGHLLRWRDGKVIEGRGGIYGDGTNEYDLFWSPVAEHSGQRINAGD